MYFLVPLRLVYSTASAKGPSTLATLFSHRWPRIVAGIFIPVGNHYFQALASTLQFVAQVCDRLWLVPATDRAFAYITYMSPPHVALVCSGPPQKRGHMWLSKVASGQYVLPPDDAVVSWPFNNHTGNNIPFVLVHINYFYLEMLRCSIISLCCFSFQSFP